MRREQQAREDALSDEAKQIKGLQAELTRLKGILSKAGIKPPI
ncbi:MAG: hypothetical protein ACXV5Q_09330 [Frankiaceae bacterium]